MSRSTTKDYMHRYFSPVAVLVAAAVLTLALAVVSGASAGQRTQDTFDFSDPFDGTFECDGFTAEISGHDKGHVKTWLDADGNEIKQEGHIQAIETDTNLSTGKSIVARTDLHVHVDFVAGTIQLSGARNISTDPGQGVVVQHVGRVVIGPDDEPISLSGKFPEFEEAYMNDDWCAALA